MIQHQCTAAMVRAKKLFQCSVLLCKKSLQHCVTAVTNKEICSSYRCAVMQQQCTAALVRAKQLSHCSVLLCKQGSQQALCHCSCTYGDLLFIQVCIDATLMHCSTGQGKTASPVFSAALHNRLTACLCHCNCSYGDLLFIQVCSDATMYALQHWSGQNSCPTVRCCSANQAHSMLVSLQLHLWRFAFHTGVQ